MTSLTQRIINNARWIVGLGSLLSLGSFVFTALLYLNLRTDIIELLPTTARSVIDLDTIQKRLLSTDNLTILVFAPNRQTGRQFVDRLVTELRPAVPKTIAALEYQIQDELDFFLSRQALFIDVADLERIRAMIEKRIKFETELRNPLNIFRSTEIQEPQDEFSTIRDHYSSKINSFTQFEDGYYASQDGKRFAVIAHLPGNAVGIGSALKMQKVIDQAVQKLDPSSIHPELSVRYTGSVRNMIEEHEALLEDLEVSTLIVLALTLFAMLAFFRSFRGTFALLTALMMGTGWCFGIAYFALGFLNANSAFLAAIVIGNGINFGIILLARYLEERRRKKSHFYALHRALTQTSRATLTAALAAGLSYGSLMLTSFRGFSQFGLIGLVGMVTCWLSAYLMLPALLTLVYQSKPRNFFVKTTDQGPSFFSRFIRALISRFAWPILLFSIVFSGVSIFAIQHHKGSILQSDLTKLRSKKSMESGSGALQKYVDDIFKRDLTPLVVLAPNRKVARKMATALKQVAQKKPGIDAIGEVISVDDFIPPDQEARIKKIAAIRALLSPSILKRLDPETQAEAHEYLTDESLKPIQPGDLPPLVRRNFTEKEGAFGNLVLVGLRETAGKWGGDELAFFIGLIRDTVDNIQAGTPVAGMMTITSDMYRAVRQDGPRATLFAFLAVLALVTLLFRSLRLISIAMLALLLGVLWLFGLIFGFDLQINFLNFIALPITFGIGVDYGVNIFERYRHEGRGGILRTLDHTAAAVSLASFTTIVGYGSLLLASNQAFNSFGLLAILGEITCLFAALLTVPSVLFLLDSKRKNR